MATGIIISAIATRTNSNRSPVFGEVYWEATPNLKLTAGLRYTEDRKKFTPWRSQLLVPGDSYGPADPIRQKWGEFTGRIGIDWKPDLSFADDTMIYAFYSRGYKGGGANPPPAQPIAGLSRRFGNSADVRARIRQCLRARFQEQLPRRRADPERLRFLL